MFNHAELKIGRANKHIDEFNAEVRRYIDENPHTVDVEFDSDYGCDVLQVRAPRKTLPQEVALPVGDAIHNLHTALDFIWYEFVRQDLVGALNGRKIPTHLQGIENFILDVVKPYQGSDTRMWEFHHLDITDKHEYLIPQLKFTTILNMRAEDQDGNPIPMPRSKTFVSGFTSTVLMPTGHRNVKLTDKGQLTANVLFHKGPLRGWMASNTARESPKTACCPVTVLPTIPFIHHIRGVSNIFIPLDVVVWIWVPAFWGLTEFSARDRR